MKHFYAGIVFFSALTSQVALADYTLANNGKVVLCTAEDNREFKLNAKRTTIKWSSEGESLGPQKILRQTDDKKAKATFTSEEVTLTLSDAGDSVMFYGDETDVESINCR